MREAVIVSTARTPIGKAYRGAFNLTGAPTLGGHAIHHAVDRAGIGPGEVDDVVMGSALQQGTGFMNVHIFQLGNIELFADRCQVKRLATRHAA